MAIRITWRLAVDRFLGGDEFLGAWGRAKWAAEEKMPETLAGPPAIGLANLQVRQLVNQGYGRYLHRSLSNPFPFVPAVSNPSPPNIQKKASLLEGSTTYQ